MTRTLLTFTFILLVSTASANPSTRVTYANPDFQTSCGDFASKISQISPKYFPLDWPKHLQFEGISWPQWERIDPAQHMDILEITSVYPPNGSEDTESQKELSERFGTFKQRMDWWNRFMKPYYSANIRMGNVEMQAATLTDTYFGAGEMSRYSVVIDRFRFKPGTTNIFRLGGNSWEYVIASLNGYSALTNIPIGNVAGELAIYNGTAVIFTTDTFPYLELDAVGLAPGLNADDRYSIAGITGIC